jgi:NAD(P)H dehydrogenase (quinone)
MKHAVIVAHPRAGSFTQTMAKAYAEAAKALGHAVVVRDLYALDFDPRLKAEELPGPDGYKMAPDVLAEREALKDVDVFAFFYPLWFNAPPAILKGYADRVLSMGFGYDPGPRGTESRLDGKKLISFTASGAPEHWVRDTGAFTALTTLFDRHLAGVLGLSVVDHVHFGEIVPNLTEDWVKRSAHEVREAVRRNFGEG